MQTLYLDMDGVLVDFSGHIKNLFGKYSHEFASSDEFWHRASQIQNLYENPEPMQDAHFLVHNVIEWAKETSFDVEILTALPRYATMPLAEEHKRKWMEKYFGEYNLKFNVGPHAIDKQKYSEIGNILIDDNTRNIVQWRNKGGIGIFHTDAKSSLKELVNCIYWT